MTSIGQDPSAAGEEALPTLTGPVAVVGAGSIGVAWVVTFVCAGRNVHLFDVDAARLRDAAAEVTSTVARLTTAGLVSGDPEGGVGVVTTCTSLKDAVSGVCHVQECIVEDLEAKKRLFADLDRLTPPEVVLASSTSTILASRFAEQVPGRERCLVVHPGNPPYFLRVAEIVPAPFTSPEAIRRAESMLRSTDMAPVVLRAEIEGFVFNRLQGALLREAYCLVRDNIVSPVDLDTLVRDGLGKRWSVLGPFATSEINTRGGLRHHAQLHGRVYARFGLERADDDPWTTETVEQVASAIQANLPHRDWADNVRERDQTMIAHAASQKDFHNSLTPDPTTSIKTDQTRQ